jgi:arginase
LTPSRWCCSATASSVTRFELGAIQRLGLAHTSLEEVQEAPESAAHEVLQLLAHYVIHLDVDVVDFTDAPLSEHRSRNAGLKLKEMLRALKVLASGSDLVAITLTELNPHNAAADEGLLERFAAAFAEAIGTVTEISDLQLNQRKEAKLALNLTELKTT